MGKERHVHDSQMPRLYFPFFFLVGAWERLGAWSVLQSIAIHNCLYWPVKIKTEEDIIYVII